MSSQNSPLKEVGLLDKTLLNIAKTKPDQFPAFFKQARLTYPSELTRACLHYLAEQELDVAGRQMILWLSSGPSYLDIILDYKSTKFEVAKKLFVLFRHEDPQFFMKLLELTDRQETLASNSLLMRALDVLGSLENLSSFVRWLQRLTYRQDGRIRSKAAKLICGMGLNAALIQRNLKSEDNRVRANTVEALWGTLTKEAEAIYLKAINDECHRVAANAIVGLYPINKEIALETLEQLTEHPSHMFRLAMVWAINKIADEKGIELLPRLIQDESPLVRKKAQTTFDALQTQKAAIADGTTLLS